jgi:hypothetical protein
MLTEDDVVDAVCGLLTAHGYVIVRRALATQHGDDIVAEKDSARLVIEAKGAGSSKEGTARFGRSFSSGQVFSHVAKAVLKALRVVAAGGSRAGVAFPDDAVHRREVAQVSAALRELGVAVFWVAESGEIEVDTPWTL